MHPCVVLCKRTHCNLVSVRGLFDLITSYLPLSCLHPPTKVFGPYFGPKFFANFKTEENVRSVLKQVYCRDDVVDDDLVNL